MKKIPWAIPDIGLDEKREVDKLFDINWLSMGKKVREFEENMQNYFQRKNAIAVSNGTIALDIALKILKVSPGDEVIVPAMTYIATGSMVLNQGATPVFADIDKETFTVTRESIESVITPKTKVVITMDYGGNSCDYDGITELCKEKGVYLIVDAAQSLGGKYKTKALGSFGDISTVSFHSAKIMTTIEGGMIMTDNDEFAEKMKIMRNQGEDTAQKYKHIMLGFNARMMDMQAAIGLVQFKKLESYLERRNWIAEKYVSSFSKSNKIKTIKVKSYSKMAWFLFPILVENRDKVNFEINKSGIDTRLCYHYPLYKHPMFSKYSNCYKENAESISKRVINLPIFPMLKNEEVDYICENILKIVEK